MLTFLKDKFSDTQNYIQVLSAYFKMLLNKLGQADENL